MTIATKNGVPIISGGLVATNCDCCAAWYCCDERLFTPECSIPGMSQIARITVTLEAVDYFRHDIVTALPAQDLFIDFFGCDKMTTTATQTAFTPGASFSGTVNLVPSYFGFLGAEDIWLFAHEYTDSVGCAATLSTALAVNRFTKAIRWSNMTLVHKYYAYGALKQGGSLGYQAQPQDMACVSETIGKSPCDQPFDFDGSQNDVQVNKVALTSNSVGSFFNFVIPGTFPACRQTGPGGGFSRSGSMTLQGASVGAAGGPGGGVFRPTSYELVSETGSLDLSWSATLSFL